MYKNKGFKRTAIAMCVASCITGVSGNLLADEKQEEEDEQVVTIVGIRGSLQASLNTKRHSNAIVDAITSEDIGKFPDKNIGDALQRMSGVTVDRQYGEVSGITIRGTAPEQSRILLNGQTVASTSWYDLGPATRTFNMELLSAEQVTAVEVYKSPEARIEEGALGGTVNLITRKPLDLDDNTVMVSAELSTSSLYDETDPSAAFMGSWKNDQETFGILAAYSLEKLTSGRNVLESIGGYYESFVADAGTGQESTVSAWSIGSQAFRAERERTSAQITAQFTPVENLDLTLDYFNFEFDNPHVNHNFLTVTARGSATTNVVNNAGGGTASATVLPAYASIIYNPVVRNAVNMKTDILNFSAAYEGSNYKLSGVIGQSKSDGGTQGGASSWWIPATDQGDRIGDPAFPGGQSSVDGGFSYDATGPYQVQLTTLDATDASQLKHAQEANYETTVQQHDVSYAQVDFVYDLDGSTFENIAIGLKSNTSEFSRQAFNRNPSEIIGFVPNPNLANWTGGTFTNLHSQSSGNTLNSYAYLDTDKWWEFISERYRNGDLVEVANLGNTFSVDEEILAFYLQSDFSGENYRGNIGFRYVETEQTSEGFAGGNPFKETVDYNNFLPNINIAFDLRDDLVLRAAASSVIARNNYSDLKPGLAINASFGTADGGNSDLSPYESDQFDIGIEWYFGPSSLASAAVFNKEIKNVVFVVESQEFVENCGAAQADWANCRVTRPRNGGDGSVTGLELQLQHAFDNGFGVVTNYTYIDSESSGPDGKSMVPGVSKNSFNVSAFYENELISTRVSNNWRNQWIGVGAAQSVLNNSYSQWDASITWHAMENLDISVEGVNLTNEVIESKDVKYNLTQNTIEFGSRYYLSASYKF